MAGTFARPAVRQDRRHAPRMLRSAALGACRRSTIPGVHPVVILHVRLPPFGASCSVVATRGTLHSYATLELLPRRIDNTRAAHRCEFLVWLPLACECRAQYTLLLVQLATYTHST